MEKEKKALEYFDYLRVLVSKVNPEEVKEYLYDLMAELLDEQYGKDTIAKYRFKQLTRVDQDVYIFSNPDDKRAPICVMYIIPEQSYHAVVSFEQLNIDLQVLYIRQFIKEHYL